jgi:hypothetical protein
MYVKNLVTILVSFVKCVKVAYFFVFVFVFDTERSLEILHIQKKGHLLNTLERFHIYNLEGRGFDSR